MLSIVAQCGALTKIIRSTNYKSFRAGQLDLSSSVIITHIHIHVLCYPAVSLQVETSRRSRSSFVATNSHWTVVYDDTQSTASF